MRSAGAGVGAVVGLALDGAKFGFNDFGNQLVRGTLTGLAAGTTAAVMRGGRISVQQVATDAFGNALGSSLAGGSFSGVGQNEDRLGDFIAQQETAQTQRDQYRPYTGGADWATDVAMRRAGYPTYAQSAPQPYGNDEFRSSERAYRSATESSMPGTSRRAGAGDSISSMMGTSEPQAIGNFMRANNLTTDRLQAGGTYFVPASADSYGDQQGLGQGALNAGNARIAARQEAAAQAASMDRANQQRWDAMQVGAWSGRTGQVSAAFVVPDSQGQMSYSEQMRNVGRFFGDVGSGAVKGLGNLLPETAAFAYRLTGYAAAGSMSLVNTDASDRMFAQYERVTGRVFGYNNGVQEFGGVAAQLAAPTIFKGISAGGSRLYEFEQNAKKTINYDYRQYFNGTTTLEAETTFYSYKNSNYLTPNATFSPKELWLTPDLMTSQQAVQKLALPYGTGYDTLLTVNLPAATQIMTPRSVWSLFGRPGGGVETRVYSPVTSDMYRISSPPK